MKRLIIPVTAALMAWSGCSKSGNGDNGKDSDYLGIGGVTTVGQTVRADLPNGPLTSGSIGVFAFQGAENHDNNVGYAYTGTGWEATAEPVPLTDIGAKVYAYYPLHTTVDGAGSDSPSIGITDNTTAQTDYLYSGIIQKTDNSGDDEFTRSHASIAKLKMYHALAKIVFTKARDAAYPGDAIISSIVLKNSAGQNILVTGGTMDLRTGTITPNTTATQYTFLSGNTDSFKNGIISATRMVIPAALPAKGDVVAEITMDGLPYELQIPAGNWKKGTINTYNLTFTAGKLGIQSVEIQDWTTGEIVDVPIE